MAKSFFGGTDEYVGAVPAGGYKCRIEEIERTVTSENARTPGVKQYRANLRVIEPKKNAGAPLSDWFQIGTEDDPKGRDQATWQQSLGAKKLVRLLKRAGVAARDGDDEEWMDAAQGQEICVHVTKERDDNGIWRNRVNGEYFRENDEDFVGVGELLEAAEGGRGRNGRTARKDAREAGAGGTRPARRMPADEADDEPPARRAKPKDDEDEPQPKAARKAKDDEGEDDEPPPARKAKAAPKGKAKDDDEDDDED